MNFNLNRRILFSFLLAINPVCTEEIVLRGDVYGIRHSINAQQRKSYYHDFTQEANYPNLDRHALINLIFMLLLKHNLIPFNVGKFAPVFYENAEHEKNRQRLLAPEFFRDISLSEGDKLVILVKTNDPVPLYSYDDKIAPWKPRSCVAQAGKKIGQFELNELRIEISERKAEAHFIATISHQDSANGLFRNIKIHNYLEDALRALIIEFILVLEQYKTKTYSSACVQDMMPSVLKNLHLLHYSNPHSTALLFLYSPRFIYHGVLGYILREISYFLMDHYEEVSEIFDDRKTFGTRIDILSIKSVLDDKSGIWHDQEEDPRVWLAGEGLIPALMITIKRSQSDKGTQLVLEVSLAATRRSKGREKTYGVIRRGSFVREQKVIPRKLDPKVDFPPFLIFQERAMVTRVARIFLFSAAIWMKKQGRKKINKALGIFVRKESQTFHAYISANREWHSGNTLVPLTIIPGAFGPVVQNFKKELERLISDRATLPKSSYKLFSHHSRDGKQRCELRLEQLYKCDFGLPSWYVGNVDILGWSWLRQTKDYLSEDENI